MEKYYFAAKSFELHTRMICVKDVFVVFLLLTGFVCLVHISDVIFDANQSREYKCSLFTQEISHVCNGTIICYLPFLELQKNSLKPPEEPAADIMMIFLRQRYT